MPCSLFQYFAICRYMLQYIDRCNFSHFQVICLHVRVLVWTRACACVCVRLHLAVLFRVCRVCAPLWVCPAKLTSSASQLRIRLLHENQNENCNDSVILTWSEYHITVCCNVLHSVAACCGVLLCVAVPQIHSWQCLAAYCIVLRLVEICCSVLQCVAVRCNVWQYLRDVVGSSVVLGCIVLRCVAVCCSVMQCVAGCCRLFLYFRVVVGSSVDHGCSVLRCTEVWCSVMQCVAVCCSVLQYLRDVVCSSVDLGNHNRAYALHLTRKLVINWRQLQRYICMQICIESLYRYVYIYTHT